MKRLKLLFFFAIFSQNPVYACTGGTPSGTLTPTAAYQTIATQNGRSYTVNVTACNQYEFSFCNGGGTSAFDTQITILNASGTTELAYSDDFCSLNSHVNWTSTITGTIIVLISKFSCVNDLSSNCTLAYKMVANTGSYCLGGNASYQTIGGNNCIQLTAEVNDQTGCAWNQNVIDFNQPFNLSLNYYFGNNINGADGTTFTFQPNLGACGQAGGQLGAGGIANALVIEFDTYDNDNPAHIYDLSADHIAVEIDGNLLGPGAPYCGPVPAFASLANLDDGNSHTIQISWNPATLNLTVYVDGALRLTCNGDFVTTVFGGNSQIHWGATAATGGLNNQQYFCPSTVVLPVTVKTFDSECLTNYERIYWFVESQENVSHYTLEYTFDGFVYYPLETVPASTDKTGEIEYAIQIPKSENLRYYRLTSVDNNGQTAQSELIKSENCQVSKTILANSFLGENVITLSFNELNCSYQLVDLQGRNITSELNNGTNNLISISTENLNQSIYILKIWNKKGELETHRIFIE